MKPRSGRRRARPAPIPQATPFDTSILRRREPLTLLQFAERHVRITEGPLVGARGATVPWSFETFPLQRTILEAIGSGRWNAVYLLTPPQAFGKTQSAILPLLLYAIEHLGVSVLYVAANAHLSVTQWARKIRPAMEADEALRALFYANPDYGGTKERRDFRNGTSAHFAGAESVGNLAGFTVPIACCDDLQAYPASLPGYGHPADLAWTRTEAYPADQVRRVGCGTAGAVDDYLWRAVSSSAFFCPFVPCLGCDTYQLLEFDRMQFDPNDPAATVADTWLRCAQPKCEHRIMFHELPGMLERHLWVSTPADVNWVMDPPEGGTRLDLYENPAIYPDTRRNTNVAGFWSNAFYWPLGKTWGERCAEYLNCAGNPDRLKDYRQQTLVIPYEEPKIDEDVLTLDDVKAHSSPGHSWKIIPEAARIAEGEGVVIVTADVQAGYIWYLVEAWHIPTGSCWLLECGRYGQQPGTREFPSQLARKQQWRSRVATALDQLWAKDAAGWPVGEDGPRISGRYCLIDTSFLRETVQTSCRRYNGAKAPRWLPVEGSQAGAGHRKPVWPGIRRGSRERRTGAKYWEANTNRAKLYVRDVLSIPLGQPGALELPADMPDFLRRAFAKHLCAEEWDASKGKWIKLSGENHLLDAQALQIVGAIAAGVQLSFIDQAPADPKPIPLSEYAARRTRGFR